AASKPLGHLPQASNRSRRTCVLRGDLQAVEEPYPREFACARGTLTRRHSALNLVRLRVVTITCHYATLVDTARGYMVRGPGSSNHDASGVDGYVGGLTGAAPVIARDFDPDCTRASLA